MPLLLEAVAFEAFDASIHELQGSLRDHFRSCKHVVSTGCQLVSHLRLLCFAYLLCGQRQKGFLVIVVLLIIFLPCAAVFPPRIFTLCIIE